MILVAGEDDRGKRLDSFIHDRIGTFSRSRIQEWIKTGRVRVDGTSRKASFELRGSEMIAVEPVALPPLKATAENLPIEILYEDADVVAVNKPAGLVVHTGAGIREGTLVNRLVHHFGALSSVGGELRPGIVHRLDRYTSGVLLVAKTDAAHQALAAQFSGRTVEKTYVALVHGAMKPERGRVTAPIARDPVRRTRMTVRTNKGRTALTEWEVIQRWPQFTYLRVKIGTGRTHQIRVHLASTGHPVVGDRIYGAPAKAEGHPQFGRYFLHAQRIAFDSPSSGERIVVEAPLPQELRAYLEEL